MKCCKHEVHDINMLCNKTCNVHLSVIMCYQEYLILDFNKNLIYKLYNVYNFISVQFVIAIKSEIVKYCFSTIF